jgi:hypothetical protein
MFLFDEYPFYSAEKEIEMKCSFLDHDSGVGMGWAIVAQRSSVP